MIPVIALVGRPNVGKSTLFNRFTKSRAALVADFPGLTRDRQYGEGKFRGKPFIVIDTGGLGELEHDVDNLMYQQVGQALEEANIIFFIVDARAGLAPADMEIADKIRRLKKQVVLVVNKIDGMDANTANSEFYKLGFSQIQQISATHGRGVNNLLQQTLAEQLESTDNADVAEQAIAKGVQLAIVGRPNVGKSTLVNRLLGEERVVVYDMPGTTRDSIAIPYERHGKPYTIIDTAGVRKRGRVKQTIEKFSVIKALQAIEAADVVVMVMDGRENITEQDLHLIGFILEAGRGIVLAINKWDNLPLEQREKMKKEVSRRLQFLPYARVHYISALHGTGVGDLYKSIDEAYNAATKDLPTAELTKILQDAVAQHNPPLAGGRRIKLRYAHCGGHKPPIIVIHGTQTDKLPASYKRYLIGVFRKAFNLMGTAIRLECKSSTNPFEGKKNLLTPRQMRKRQRMMKHIKQSKRKS